MDKWNHKITTPMMSTSRQGAMSLRGISFQQDVEKESPSSHDPTPRKPLQEGWIEQANAVDVDVDVDVDSTISHDRGTINTREEERGNVEPDLVIATQSTIPSTAHDPLLPSATTRDRRMKSDNVKAHKKASKAPKAATDTPLIISEVTEPPTTAPPTAGDTTMPPAKKEEPVAEDETSTEPPENLPTKETLPTKESPPTKETLPGDPDATPSSTTSAPPKQPLATPEPVETSPPKIADTDSSSCNTLTCKGLELMNQHPLLYIILFLLVTCFCCLRCRKRRPQRDTRGEYRAVGRMLANNFDSELSDDDINFYEEDSGDEADAVGWSGKGSIELGSIGREANGGLTLEEMNG